MRQFLAPINRRFGTYRGLIRLGLAHAEHRSGRLRPFMRHDLGHVNRLVFVCQGNICRSSFADHLARSLGIPSVSFGLATTTGMRADPTAMKTSLQFGVNLKSHQVTDIGNFQFHAGDLLLAMEIRQARKLISLSLPDEVHVGLLGSWSKPRRLHIHDPFSLSDDYFVTCFQVIETAVKQLCAEYAAAKGMEIKVDV
ncbi:protein-tyrosine phosphatase [Nitrosospira sp. Nsp18]|uniref:arsenate reductase/protein-tyrosine-phosphatase family protein n=1 Tax=Nitrosospira sp. Nsp18 TaxID=1855334 RepID=UPI000886C0AE|nr:hypothetical protein [Nitrosospira sp. Nsp18]SDA18613.1 protein-tyrosine phosphatase [Nitrosospira sp. Nsp18]